MEEVPPETLCPVTNNHEPLLQEYLAQWVAKVASAEKEYRSATDQMNRPSLLASALPQAAAGESSGVLPT